MVRVGQPQRRLAQRRRAGRRRAHRAGLRADLAWTPWRVSCVAGRLAYTRYSFITRWFMRRIAGKEGASTDTSRDHELTDWTALTEQSRSSSLTRRRGRRSGSQKDSNNDDPTAGCVDTSRSMDDLVSGGLPHTPLAQHLLSRRPLRGHHVEPAQHHASRSVAFFEPAPGGGEPDYAYLANRLQLELRRAWPRVEVQLAAQHVGFAGLPGDATGPGPSVWEPSISSKEAAVGSRSSCGCDMPTSGSRRVLPGLDVTAGRMAYTSGAEAAERRRASRGPQAATPRRPDRRRVRVVAVSARLRRGARRLDAAVPSRPPASPFGRRRAALRRSPVRRSTTSASTGGTLSVQPTARLPRTQPQAFVLRYDDSRRVTQRPDNTGLAAAAADIGITSYGGTLVGSYPVGAGFRTCSRGA